MQSFQRAFALFSIIIASGFSVGCGGPGTPTPGGSDPVMEAADAALAPEGEPIASDASDASDATDATGEATTPETTEPAEEGTEAESAPE